jgi:signal peptidase II
VNVASRGRRVVLFFVVALIVLAIDVVTKAVVLARLAPGTTIELLGSALKFQLVRNSGVAFSIGNGLTPVLTMVVLAVSVAVIRFGLKGRSASLAVALGLILGGALGNLADRLFRPPGPFEGRVVDFISVGWWPVFNVADSGITCGAVLMVVAILFFDHSTSQQQTSSVLRF